MAIDINVPSQVKTYANLAAFPATGVVKTIFIAEDTNKTYRWTGSVYVEVSAAGATGITIGTTAITSGTVGRVLFEGTGNVVQESANLFWDNTNGRLGIGTSSPSTTFHLAGSSTAVSLLARSSLISSTLVASANNDVLIGLDIAPTFTNGGFTGVSNLGIRLNAEFLVSNGKAFTSSSGATANSGGFSVGQFFCVGNSGNNGYVALQGLYAGIGYTTPISINALGGNVLIGTTTNAGFKLDVNGTARVSGVFTTSIINNLALTTGGFGTTGYGMAIDAGFRWGVNAGNSYKFGHWSALNGAFNWNNASASVIEVGLGATTPNVNNITWTSVNITPTFNVNFSGRSGNIVRGIYYNPTITSFINGVRNQLRAFESSFGGAYFNTTAVDGSAILQADSTTQGFLPPRMDTTQKNAIASPTAGLMVYDNVLNRPCFYDGATWITL